MTFRTVMRPGRHEYGVRVNGARRLYFDQFEFDLIDDATTENVSVGFGPELGKWLPRELWPDVGIGAQNGVDWAAKSGVRLCCVRFTLNWAKYHDLYTTSEAVHVRVADAVAHHVAEYHTQPVPPLHPAWLTSDVVALARGIRAAGHSGGVPILTDALLEAGCDDPLVIEHLRACTDHGPCCWVAEMVCARARA
jgi:hypothetical protein